MICYNEDGKKLSFSLVLILVKKSHLITFQDQSTGYEFQIILTNSFPRQEINTEVNEQLNVALRSILPPKDKGCPMCVKLACALLPVIHLLPSFPNYCFITSLIS